MALKLRPTLYKLMRDGEISQGHELRVSDIRRSFGTLDGFGLVQPGDVGRRIWFKSYGFVMESLEQRNARRSKSPT